MKALLVVWRQAQGHYWRQLPRLWGVVVHEPIVFPCFWSKEAASAKVDDARECSRNGHECLVTFWSDLEAH